MVVLLVLLPLILILCAFGWYLSADRWLREYSGEQAAAYLLAQDPQCSSWLTDATDCYVWDGSTYSGSKWYWTSVFPDTDKCFEVLAKSVNHCDGMPLDSDSFNPFVQSEWEDVMLGPPSNGSQQHAKPWNVVGISNAVYFEHTSFNRLWFGLVDLDQHRIYLHYQTGGSLRRNAVNRSQ